MAACQGSASSRKRSGFRRGHPEESFPEIYLNPSHGYRMGVSYEPPIKSTENMAFSSILPAELLSAFSPPTGPAISPPLLPSSGAATPERAPETF